MTWLEFSSVVGVLSVLAGSLLTASFYYEELSEAAVVQLTIENIRSGLRYQIANRLVAHRATSMGELLGANPVSWVESAPAGYVGTVRNADVRALPRGSWFYDVDLAEFGYKPKLSFHLSIGPGEPILLWQVKALKTNMPREPEGLMIVAVTPYRWF